jgi:hypothetical protein
MFSRREKVFFLKKRMKVCSHLNRSTLRTETCVCESLLLIKQISFPHPRRAAGRRSGCCTVPGGHGRLFIAVASEHPSIPGVRQTNDGFYGIGR